MYTTKSGVAGTQQVIILEVGVWTMVLNIGIFY